MDKLRIFELSTRGSTIQFETNEFKAICPFDNKPDYYHVTIKYVHVGKCIESKSLRYWLLSFENISMSAEELAVHISQELSEILETQVIVTLKQGIRDTLRLTVTHGE